MELKFKNLEDQEETITEIWPATVKGESYYPEYPSAYIDLDYGGSAQGFGGYFLGGREITWRKLVLDSILGRSYDKIKYSDPRVLDREKFNEAIAGKSVLAYRQETVLGIGSSLKNAFFPKSSAEFMRDDRKNLRNALVIARSKDGYKVDNLSVEEMREFIRLSSALLEIDLDSSTEKTIKDKIARVNDEILEKRKQEKVYGESQADEISKLQGERESLEYDLKNLPIEIENLSTYLTSLTQTLIKRYDEEMAVTAEKVTENTIENIAETYGIATDKIVELEEFKAIIERRVNESLDNLERRKNKLQESRPDIEKELEKAQEILEKSKQYVKESKSKTSSSGSGEFGEE